jgi:hypothetical protein
MANRASSATSPKDAKSGPPAASASAEAKLPGKTPAKKVEDKSAATQRSTRAATLLRIGQNLEKSAKTDAALAAYRRIVKEYPNTPAARNAAERIKVLEKP